LGLSFSWLPDSYPDARRYQPTANPKSRGYANGAISHEKVLPFFDMLIQSHRVGTPNSFLIKQLPVRFHSRLIQHSVNLQ
jgi:hypothetical protein